MEKLLRECGCEKCKAILVMVEGVLAPDSAFGMSVHKLAHELEDRVRSQITQSKILGTTIFEGSSARTLMGLTYVVAHLAEVVAREVLHGDPEANRAAEALAVCVYGEMFNHLSPGVAKLFMLRRREMSERAEHVVE